MANDSFRQTVLGEVLDFFNGKAIKANAEGQYPVYGSNGIIGRTDQHKYQNAIILGRVGAYCGSVEFCSTEFWASDNTIVVKPRNESHNVKYLYYLLKDLDLNRHAGGSAQPLLTQTGLRQVSTRVPPLPIQDKIAEILSAYDDLIENNTRRIKILEEMARAIYREWFVHFRFPGHEKVKLVDSPLGKIPEGWEVKPIGDVIETLGGGTPSTKVPEYWENGEVTWFTPSDLTKSSTLFIADSEKKITSLGLKESSARMFPSYSVMMTSRATIGVTALNTSPACTNQGFITSVPTDRLSAYQIYFWIKENLEKIKSVASGATYKEINRSEFRELPILVAPEQESGRFVQTVGPILKQIENLQSKNSNLHWTRDLLLPKLISGELQVTSGV